MDREPNRHLVRISPFNAVACMRRDIEIVTVLESDGVGLPLEQDHGSALKNQNPFGIILVEPKSWWAGVPVRDDPLDA
jgi:hypothetical protein